MQETILNASTITEYIERYRDMEVSFDTLHLREKVTFTPDSSGVTEGIILGDSFCQKYRKDLEDNVRLMTIDKKDIRTYRCNPWALSYDLYGSTEFWFLLLDLNNMYSATEFTKRTIKIYDESLPDMIESILNLEEDSILTNDEEIDETTEYDVNDSDDDNDIE